MARLAGASTPISSVLCGLSLLVITPYLETIARTPKAALAGIVLSQIIPQVVKPSALRAMQGSDAVVGWSTAFVTAVVSPTVGIVWGCLIAFMLSTARGRRDHSD